MISLVIRTIVSLLANAIGLLAAAYFLDDFEVNGSSFVIAVVIFTAATIILGPLITKIALTSAPYLMGGIALVTTLVGLAITDAVSDGFSISGVSTWIAATVVIWIASLIAQFTLPWILVKAGIGRDEPAQPPQPGQAVSPQSEIR